MASTQYSLPVLSRLEIIGILAQYQIINLSESDLTNPTPNFVFNLHSSLLLHLDTLQNDPSQVDFASLERFENPDMHVDAIRALNLCRKIKDLLIAIECPLSFTLPDLLRPDSNRTLKFLSAIINFFLHRDSKMSMLRPYSDDVSLLEEEIKQREAKIVQLREEIAAFNEAKKRVKPQVLEAEAKVKELQQNLDNLNSLQSNLRKARQAMKEKAQEMTKNVSNSEYELIQASEENAILLSKIVQSPDKLQRALEEKKVLQREAKDSERQAFQNFQEKTTSLEVCTKASQKMTKQLAQMQAIQEQVNSAKSVEKDVKQLRAKLRDEELLQKSLEAKEVELKTKAEQSDEQQNLLEKERYLRHKEDTRGLNNAKLEAEQCRSYLETKGKKIEAVVTEVDSVNAKTKSTKDLAAATQEELLKKGEEIVNELNSYTRSTAQIMSNIEALQYNDPGN